MSEAGWLIDKSALARISTSPDGQEWTARVERGLVHVSTVTILEVGYSAQSAVDWSERVEMPPLSLMPVVNLTPSVERRAVEVQGMLAREGRHRAPSVPDLLIAAMAEADGLVVLQVDKDFDLVAAVTGQPVERLNVGA